VTEAVCIPSFFQFQTSTLNGPLRPPSPACWPSTGSGPSRASPT